MFKEILRNIEGFGVWAIATMIIFFVVFIVVLLYVLRTDKSHFQYMSRLPLDNQSDNK